MRAEKKVQRLIRLELTASWRSCKSGKESDTNIYKKSFRNLYE